MRILVCFKPLPCWERVLDSDWENFSLSTDLSYAGTEFGCFDEAALELALRLKQQVGQDGFCAAVTVGKVPSAPLTERLYAAGFDEITVLRDEAGEFSPRQVSARLANFAGAGGFDLILTGIDSGTAGTGALPFLLADRLRRPLLAGVQELNLAPEGILGVTQDKNGLWQRCAALPAVVSVGNSPAVLRAVNLRARLQAKGRKPQMIEGEGQFQQPEPSLSRPKLGRSCVFLPEKTPEALAEKLLNHYLFSEEQGENQKAEAAPALPETLEAVSYLPSAGKKAVLADWKKRRPPLTILPDTAWGRALTARLVHDEGCGFLTGASLVGFDEGAVYAQKRVCAANLVWTEKLIFPAVLILAGKIPESVAAISVDGGEKALSDGLLWEKCLELSAPVGPHNPKLTLICGMGIGSRENCDKARKLAEKLGAGFGLTRPAALSGWGSPEEIVGQSGESILPQTCLVLGASGAGAFAAGFEGSGRVIAVNTDKNALIFRHADFGITEDCVSLTEALLKKL